MESKKQELFDFLLQHKIEGALYSHPPLFSCEDEKVLIKEEIPGISTKNLFLVDQDGQHYLVVVSCDKKVALNQLRKSMGCKKLSFGSPENMMRHLGVSPGAVTILGLIFDHEKHVKVLLDEQIHKAQYLKCHPMDNAMTMVLERKEIDCFLQSLRRDYIVIDVPERIPGQ